MHGMKNMSSMGLLWMRQWSSQIHKRRVIYSNSARHVLTKVFMKITPCWPWRWRWIGQSTGRNVPDGLNLHQHRCENFRTTYCCPETSARNYQSTIHKIPKERRLVASEAWNHATLEVLRILLSAGCFLCCDVHMYAGRFRYKKIIPQQVKGKKK
jgi:hypothetical protein